MRIDQAVGRLKNKARDLRDEDNFTAAHDYQSAASDLERLWGRAERTVPRIASRTRTVPGREGKGWLMSDDYFFGREELLSWPGPLAGERGSLEPRRGTFTITGFNGKTSVALPYDVGIGPVTAAFNGKSDAIVGLELMGDMLDRIAR